VNRHEASNAPTPEALNFKCWPPRARHRHHKPGKPGAGRTGGRSKLNGSIDPEEGGDRDAEARRRKAELCRHQRRRNSARATIDVVREDRRGDDDYECWDWRAAEEGWIQGVMVHNRDADEEEVRARSESLGRNGGADGRKERFGKRNAP